MSRLLDARARIHSALDAGEVRSGTTGQWSAPCILVEAGEPWADPKKSLGGRRLTRWRLTAVAGRVDSEAAITALADLIDGCDAALLAAPGIELPTWGQTFNGLLDGIPYALSSGMIQVLTEEG